MTLDGGRGLVRGDKFFRRFHLTNLQGWYANEAWLTVKADPAADADGSATFQKIITAVNAAGTGHIEDTGQTSGVCVLRFDLTSTNTEAMTAGTTYTWDGQVTLTDGTLTQILTFARGPVQAIDQVTRDT
jgi:hypothetical protein